MGLNGFFSVTKSKGWFCPTAAIEYLIHFIICTWSRYSFGYFPHILFMVGTVCGLISFSCWHICPQKWNTSLNDSGTYKANSLGHHPINLQTIKLYLLFSKMDRAHDSFQRVQIITLQQEKNQLLQALQKSSWFVMSCCDPHRRILLDAQCTMMTSERHRQFRGQCHLPMTSECSMNNDSSPVLCRNQK